MDKQLSFVNLLSDTITTTHSLYLATLLKGVACDMLLALVLTLPAAASQADAPDCPRQR
ncbi:MAG: hypothetical protein ACR5LG_11110 [Sodalis sp. (in: enterobacteria)]|uniref:hypothetical protein n=1 Tax=Sodalis sp. (in: enterobacteria) TaxID=1898979 RepID=UPI003F316D20